MQPFCSRNFRSALHDACVNQVLPVKGASNNVMRPYLESLIWDSQRGYRAMGYRIGGNGSVE
jgi:hypothetical protein